MAVGCSGSAGGRADSDPLALIDHHERAQTPATTEGGALEQEVGCEAAMVG
jgi:hypothetical protein